MGIATVPAAAARLGLTEQRVRQLLASGELKGTKVGRDWTIELVALARFARKKRKPGRPS